VSLDKYRNEICRCGSGKKFKHCCLLIRYQAEAGVETPLARELAEKEVKYWKKRYDRVKSK
jgi:hypothetical protein